MRFSLFICVFVLFSCASDDELKNQQSPEIALRDALQLLKEDELLEAKNAFYALTIRFAGTATAETAQYYLGETHTKMDKHLLAANAYFQVHDRFKGSEYAERAQYKEAKAYERLSPDMALDQSYTKQSIQKYTDFIADYPESEFRKDSEFAINELTNKLARKLYDNARIYYKLEKWRAAFKYIKLVKQRFENAPILLETYMLQVKIHIEKEEWIQAEQELEVTRNKFPTRLESHDDYTEILADIAEGKANQLDG
jgi:outer membrane protein assembly factor BamD